VSVARSSLHAPGRGLAHSMTSSNSSLERRSLRVRLRASFARRGITGTAVAAASNIGIRLRRFGFYTAESCFDLWHGVETRGIFFHDESVAQGNPVYAHAKHYGGTYPRSFRRYVRSLGIDYARYSFVDLGSGKGKALLLAAEYPFRRIIGVELFEPWAEVARRNLVSAKRFRKATTSDVELVLGDAATFHYPNEPLVVYVHNSFDAVLMNVVVTAIQRSLTSAPRDLYLIYHGPWQRHITDSVATWEPIAEFRKCVIYRATEDAAKAAAVAS
jgi:SAM-dependent methyltransferase